MSVAEQTVVEALRARGWLAKVADSQFFARESGLASLNGVQLREREDAVQLVAKHLQRLHEADAIFTKGWKPLEAREVVDLAEAVVADLRAAATVETPKPVVQEPTPAETKTISWVHESKILHEYLASKNAPVQAHAVATVLLDHMNSKGVMEPGRKTIARLSGLSIWSVARYLTWLRENRVIYLTGKQRMNELGEYQTNSYRFHKATGIR